MNIEQPEIMTAPAITYAHTMFSTIYFIYNERVCGVCMYIHLYVRKAVLKLYDIIINYIDFY